jgi:hypothetical protein
LLEEEEGEEGGNAIAAGGAGAESVGHGRKMTFAAAAMREKETGRGKVATRGGNENFQNAREGSPYL